MSIRKPSPTMLAMMAQCAAASPITAAMQRLRADTGRDFGIAVKQGRWQGHEGSGRDCKPVTNWETSREAALIALQAFAAATTKGR